MDEAELRRQYGSEWELGGLEGECARLREDLEQARGRIEELESDQKQRSGRIMNLELKLNATREERNHLWAAVAAALAGVQESPGTNMVKLRIELVDGLRAAFRSEPTGG